MSDPIIVYDKDGKRMVLAAPTWVKEQVAAGNLFLSPPDSPDLDSLSDDELKELAREAGIKSWHLMKRETLLKELRGDDG